MTVPCRLPLPGSGSRSLAPAPRAWLPLLAPRAWLYMQAHALAKRTHKKSHHCTRQWWRLVAYVVFGYLNAKRLYGSPSRTTSA